MHEHKSVLQRRDGCKYYISSLHGNHISSNVVQRNVMTATFKKAMGGKIHKIHKVHKQQSPQEVQSCKQSAALASRNVFSRPVIALKGFPRL